MIGVQNDFDTRADEVQGYFRFVLGFIDGHFDLSQAKETSAAFTPKESEDLVKTLKASCYLLLYNLVESTMRNAVEAIYDELRMNAVDFDSCRDELKKEILKNFKKRSSDKLLPKLMNMAVDIVHVTFERSETFSGNLDAKAIRETASRFGFSPPLKKDDWMLRTVKDFRNDLAHGVKSFADVGRDATASELRDARDQTVRVLNETLKNISAFLTNKEYLAAPTL